MRTKIFLVISLFLFQVVASAQSDEGFILKKLSRRLKGIDPAPAEYQALEKAVDKNQFLNEKAVEYSKSEEHSYVLNFHLDELFRFRTQKKPFSALKENRTNIYNSQDYTNYLVNNAANDLFRRLVTENLSWDELLTAKKYRGLFSSENSAVTDAGFLSALINLGTPSSGFHSFLESDQDIPQDYIKQFEVTFKPDDFRLAGVLTTARFSERYTNTAINKNRRRAAAIYRIFLGQNMLPAIAQGTDAVHEINKMAFGKKFEITKLDVKSSYTGDLHGKNPACFKCHQMLDPMGKSFATTGWILGDVASKGALVLPKRKFIKETQGIGELGKIITEQPEYAQTQVRHLWTWYIGKDIPLIGNRLKEMIAAFDTLKRKTADYIAFLVSQREFRQPEEFLGQKTAILAHGAQEILTNNCVQCHQGGSSIPTIDFNTLAIGNRNILDSAALLYQKVITKRTMPKNSSLTDDEIELLKDWFMSGLPDSEGKVRVESEVLKAKLLNMETKK